MGRAALAAVAASLGAHGLAFALALSGAPAEISLVGTRPVAVELWKEKEEAGPGAAQRRLARQAAARAGAPKPPRAAQQPKLVPPEVAQHARAARSGVAAPPAEPPDARAGSPSPAAPTAAAFAGAAVLASVTPPGVAERSVYSEGDVDAPALPAHRIKPRYPPRALALGREADVRLDVTVERDGLVSAVAVAKSGGAEFDDEAARAVQSARFRPATRAGEPVAVRLRMTVRFRLDE